MISQGTLIHNINIAIYCELNAIIYKKLDNNSLSKQGLSVLKHFLKLLLLKDLLRSKQRLKLFLKLI